MSELSTRVRYGLALLVLGLVAGCGAWASDLDVGRLASSAGLPAEGTENAEDTERWSVEPPGPLRGAPTRADLLVTGAKPLSRELRTRIAKTAGVRSAESLAVASVALGDRTITVAAVDSTVFRRYTFKATAESDEVWRIVASGEAVITHQIGRDLLQPLGKNLVLRSGQRHVGMRIGAYATTVPQIDAVVNHKRGEQLGMKRDNAMLLSVAGKDVAAISAAVERVTGERAQVVRLFEAAPTTGSRQAAYLTGGAVAAAVGSFRYQYFEDGSVRPDGNWVANNVRTETVPILGRVTCHRVMLGQLRSALDEIQRSGLADKIDVSDYGGCYAPRFIGRDPSRGLSLHTWGIALDLNVSGNQRGTVGEIDRRVVAIFKRWGFAWGGDWDWTDPMHFELAALVR